MAICLDFNGSSSSIINTSASSLNSTTISLSAWTYVENTTAGQTPVIFDLSNGTSQSIFLLYHEVSNRRAYFKIGATRTIGEWCTPNNSWPVNTWVHISLTYDSALTSNDPVIYLNGVSQSITEIAKPNGISSGVTRVQCGRDMGGTSGYWLDGRLCYAIAATRLLGSGRALEIMRRPWIVWSNLFWDCLNTGNQIDRSGSGLTGTVANVSAADGSPKTIL